MIDINRAREIAENYINLNNHLDDDQIVIVDSATLEKRNAWIFFWDSKKYMETEDIRHALGGNAPVLVFKDSGRCVFLGTARAIDVYLRELGVD